ncbi:MAG: mechanosensitive ion channel family protein [Proteobacteria bacterium]|nr:mechanosensitive ion channel family protein [Cystobacterineae bacterium]MCL2259000.1 mechanosensitive ion channel family protein [Cystobacterineae bacterium]MCL2314217.1 mechanosensitive ion channel family protein [Pseudomonadota bacterium]
MNVSNLCFQLRLAVATATPSPAPPEEWQSNLGLWLLSQLPEGLRQMGPYQLGYWQWLALPLLVVFFWLATGLLKSISKRLLFKLVPKTLEGENQTLAQKLATPIRMLWFSILMRLFVPVLSLPTQVAAFVDNIFAALLIAVLFWSLLKLVDVVAETIKKRLSSSRGGNSANVLIQSTSQLVKGLLVVLGVLSLLSYFGYPVTSMLAGLGVGGIAVALASQKTIENLLGAFLIRLDQPFRMGDFVQIGELKGHVEYVGFRSTRIRTAERTLVTLPNGALADQRIENHASRDRFRFFATVGLVYETQATQMKTVLAGIEAMLKAHPKIWEPNSIGVCFREMAASSLDIEVVAYFVAANAKEFHAIRQEVLLKLMEIVENAGSAIAFPSSTVYLAKTK